MLRLLSNAPRLEEAAARMREAWRTSPTRCGYRTELPLPKAPELNPAKVSVRNGAQALLGPGTGEVTTEQDQLWDSPQCRAMSSIKCPRLLKTRCVPWPPFVGFVMSGSQR